MTRAYAKAKDGKASDYWVSSVQFLIRKDGIFDETIDILESLARMVIVGGAWPFDQEETNRIWERIRRTNRLIDFALDSVVSGFHIPTADTDTDLARRLAKPTKEEMGELLQRARTKRRIKSKQGKRQRAFR